MNIRQKLRTALPDLPKKLAVAAKYALENPDRIALDSMRKTAADVGVTSTTMLRLARQIGFDSYDEFKASFQAELVQGGFGARAGALRQDPPGSDLPLSDRIFSAAADNIERARQTLSQTDLRDVAKLMRDAPEVYLVGSGSLFWLAAMMKNTGNMILPNLRLVGAEYSVAAEAMGLAAPNDVVICFGMNPLAQRTRDAMLFARERGVHTVAITDKPSSRLVDGAMYAFISDSTSPHYYPSAAPMMVIVEALLATVVAEGDGSELARIKAFEAMRRKSGKYAEV
ncbi:MAG: MurR/RpiR family transcriptional regulator [Rhodobacteraceae bacterium]|nr:MurR/RpiR family transcriptional regulator [Paracoccaceae bacterium]